MLSFQTKFSRSADSRFETEMARIFGSERVGKFSAEHKAWLRELWDAAFTNGMDRQREFEIGQVIDRHIAEVLVAPIQGGITFNFRENTPRDVRETIRDYVETYNSASERFPW